MIEEKKTEIPEGQEAVAQAILRLADWIKKVCDGSGVYEQDILPDMVMSTAELYKAYHATYTRNRWLEIRQTRRLKKR